MLIQFVTLLKDLLSGETIPYTLRGGPVKTLKKLAQAMSNVGDLRPLT